MEFEVYALGITHASICTSLDLEEATNRLNKEHPTMISSEWVPSAIDTFSGGEPNPCDCKDHLGNKHYLFSC